MTFLGSMARQARGIAAAPVFLAVAQPAWAEEAEGGLPQFDLAAFPAQLFWLAVCFATLYALMVFLIVPQFRDTQDNRKKVITTELDAARAANDSARRTVEELEKSLAKARAEALEHVSEMVAEVTAENTAHQTAKEKELQRKMNRAEADIAVGREKALSAVRSEAEGLAATIVERLVGSKVRISS